jgi:hypothetical protein
MESRRQIASVVGVIVLIVIMVAGTELGWWPVSAVLANVVPYFLAAGIIGLFVWGFRDRIEFWSSPKPERPSPVKTTVEIQGVEKKDREKDIASHRDELMTKFKEFAYTDFRRAGKVSEKPIELGWREFIELFPHHKEFFQHLCTGHNNLYRSLTKDQGRFEHDLDEMVLGSEIGGNVLQGVCRQCVNLHDEKDRQRLNDLLSTCA